MPTPVSPRISTVVGAAATLRTSSNTRTIAGSATTTPGGAGAATRTGSETSPTGAPEKRSCGFTVCGCLGLRDGGLRRQPAQLGHARSGVTDDQAGMLVVLERLDNGSAGKDRRHARQLVGSGANAQECDHTLRRQGAQTLQLGVEPAPVRHARHGALGEQDFGGADAHDVARAQRSLDLAQAVAVQPGTVAAAEIGDGGLIAAAANACVLARCLGVLEPNGGSRRAAEHDLVAVVDVDDLAAIALAHHEVESNRAFRRGRLDVPRIDCRRVAHVSQFNPVTSVRSLHNWLQ